jgi:hypothetical protein
MKAIRYRYYALLAALLAGPAGIFLTTTVARAGENWSMHMR